MVDTRAGSCDLVEPLITAGLPVEETVLDSGDLAWLGKGVDDAGVFCCIEHKKLPDLVSSLTSERLAGHQLRKMVKGYDRWYLIAEGEWRIDGGGRVVVPHKFRRNTWVPLKGCPMASVFEQRIWTLEHCGGLRVCWTADQAESVRLITTLYRWWTDKAITERKSHLALYAPNLDPKLKEDVSDFRYGLNGAVPGLGLQRTAAIEHAVWSDDKREGSWRKLLLLTPKQIADITVGNKKLGAKRAEHIAERLR